MLEKYLKSCSDDKKAKFPNVAGFCRFCGVGTDIFDELRETDPKLHSAVCAVLEDEALNSSVSASVLSVYLKLRLGYEKTGEKSTADVGRIQLVFDHDAFSDGE